jgi:hypothetical protein
MAKRRGNPNWGKAQPLMLATGSCEFDALVKALKLRPEQLENSVELRQWSIRNKDHKYVPQDLLEAWDLSPKTGL